MRVIGYYNHYYHHYLLDLGLGPLWVFFNFSWGTGVSDRDRESNLIDTREADGPLAVKMYLTVLRAAYFGYLLSCQHNKHYSIYTQIYTLKIISAKQ